MNLNELSDLIAKATPGPWVRETEWDEEDRAEVPALGIRGQEYLQKGYEHHGPVSDCVCKLGFTGHLKHQDNLKLILSLRNLAPELMALWEAENAAERLRKIMGNPAEAKAYEGGLMMLQQHIREAQWKCRECINALNAKAETIAAG